MKIPSRTSELILKSQKYDGKIRELGLKLQEIVNAKNSAIQRQRYEESSKLRAEEVALVHELELLLENNS